MHTADWQLGKPFAVIRDDQKRSEVQKARIDAIRRIGEAARASNAEFVLVAGDMFDSIRVHKSTVSGACSAIGNISLPVIAIPGNHDHGGPGNLWEQEFFVRERQSLAPNLKILQQAVPYEVDSAVILPCPLLRRAVNLDPTEWLRSSDVYRDLSQDKPRIVLAHGSTEPFLTQWEDGEDEFGSKNTIDIGRLPQEEVDYVALGDWHGTKEISEKVWYSGAHESDRFPKGPHYDSGNILVVNAQRGLVPRVEKRYIEILKWTEFSFDFVGDTPFSDLEDRLSGILEQRVNKDILQLELKGSIGIETRSRLDKFIERLRARLLRLALVDKVRIAPTDEEIGFLTRRAADPLIASVAKQLSQEAQGDGQEADIARIALSRLHQVCKEEESL